MLTTEAPGPQQCHIPAILVRRIYYLPECRDDDPRNIIAQGRLETSNRYCSASHMHMSGQNLICYEMDPATNFGVYFQDNLVSIEANPGCDGADEEGTIESA